ncbi:MAG: helix-turn-helix domain-containing protein [Lachnospiraceae bacterium]|nr:helix-turn-helix domain-containing protein [Lachnospiraceae bacterium]
MKKENTSIRLKKIMLDRGLRQIDILNRTLPFCDKYGIKMNKSDISQYCSGKVEPTQDKLFILCEALNVSEAWLMGYDVPMERNLHIFTPSQTVPYHVHCDTEEECKMICNYRELSRLNQEKAFCYIENLAKIERADIEITDAVHRTLKRM